MSTPVVSTASNYVNMAAGMASSPEAAEAGLVMKQTAQDIKSEVTQDNDWSLRVLTLVAGLAMMIASLHGFLSELVTFRLDSVICAAIAFVVGFAFVVLESGLVRLPICATTDAVINTKAPFLRSLAGRGGVLIGTGMLEIYMREFLDTIVGCFAIYVGGMYFITRYRAKQKVEAARKSAMASGSALRGVEQVQVQFAMADADGKGSLTKAQFSQFCDSMGLALNKRESEAAFMGIDKKDHTGRLSYEAIHNWWTKGQQ